MYAGVYLACGVVAADSSNDSYVLSDRKDGQVSDDPLSAVGSLCGILKSRHLPFELETSLFPNRISKPLIIASAKGCDYQWQFLV